MLSRCFLDFSVGVRASVIGLSQISSFSPHILKYSRSGLTLTLQLPARRASCDLENNKNSQGAIYC